MTDGATSDQGEKTRLEEECTNALEGFQSDGDNVV